MAIWIRTYAPHLAYGVIGLFVLSHLIHLALGMVPLQRADWGIAPWASFFGQGLIWLALSGYFVWMLRRFYGLISRSFHWKESLVILCGLMIPLLLLPRVITLGLGIVDFNYAYTFSLFWIADPRISLIQFLGFLIVWSGVTENLYAFIRVQPRLIPFKPGITLFCVIVPTLACAGFISSLSHLELWDNPAGLLAQIGYTAENLDRIRALTFIISGGLGMMIGATILLRAGLAMWRRRYRLPQVSYKDRQHFNIPPGATLLAAIKQANIPHASVCGGNGRCSTCRVRISEGLTALPPPNAVEKKILERIKSPNNVRLACQIRPIADLKVTPLLAPTVTTQEGLQTSSYHQGEEREIAILFADLRGFTHFSEAQLPYDVVFILNQFCTAMGKAVTLADGYLDKFIGDGVMALFGIETGPEIGCQQALIAAANMSKNLETLNRSLENTILEPFRMGIGIHTGLVIIGEMGYGTAKKLTAIGDAVNLASRFEALTKEYKTELVISQDVAKYAALEVAHLPDAQVSIRGKREKISIIPIAKKELINLLPSLEQK